jgi:hypothetical protein
MKLKRKLQAIISYIFCPTLNYLRSHTTFEFFEKVSYLITWCAYYRAKPISTLGKSYELSLLDRYCVLS